MFKLPLRAAAVFALLSAFPLAAQTPPTPITAADMMRHIERLASDEFQGRAPGTEGERLTISYIADQMRARGLEPAGEGGTFFQPVHLVERRAGTSEVHWTANGAAIPSQAGEIVLLGKESAAAIANAPVVFAGHGVRLPQLGIDQLAGADLNGAVVLILARGPEVANFPSLAERIAMVTQAGAAAVIAVSQTVRQPEAGRAIVRLDSEVMPSISGATSIAVAQRLVAASGGNMERLLNEQPGSSFRAVALPLRVSMTVATSVQRFTSNNVLGRIRGSGSSGQAVLFLGHWDHFGTCRPEGTPDRICNGAVDNASGIAMLIEVAGRVASGPRPVRDVLFLATTAEEEGLLGAEYFAAHPVVPLDAIAAAVNMDTVAIHPAGEPVAILGRGSPALDAAIEATVVQMGRRMDPDDEAAPFIRRQDGWMLTRAGVPTVMVGGSFSDMAKLGAFLNGPYHTPEDQIGGRIVLDGATEDANLTVALARRLADPAAYQRDPRVPDEGEAE
jgi:hypothetical protein